MSRKVIWGIVRDGYGNAIVDESCYVTLTGTTTAAVIYATETSTPAITGSIVATDDHGKFIFWVDSVNYTFATQQFCITISKNGFSTIVYDNLFVVSAGTGITAVAQDTTPKLGGDLDMNGHKIANLTETDWTTAWAQAHTQNTDTGTTSATFRLNTTGVTLLDSSGGLLVEGAPGGHPSTITGGFLVARGDTDMLGGSVDIYEPTAGKYSRVTFAGTSNRSIYLPDKTGTISLTTDVSPTVSGTYTGQAVTLTAGENVVLGSACYCKSDGKYWKADANSLATMPVVAIALATISANNSGLFMIQPGSMICNTGWSWTVGGLIYARETAGGLTQVAPVTSGAQVQIVGYAHSATVMVFNPGGYTMVEAV